MGEFPEKGLCLRKVPVGVAVRKNMPVEDHIQIIFPGKADAAVQDLTETVLFSLV